MVNQNYQAQYLKDYKRIDRRRALVQLAAPPDSLPIVRVVGGQLDGVEAEQWAIKQYNTTCDSLILWFTDTLISSIDSLQLSVRFRKPDTLDVMNWTTDTLRFFFRDTENKKKKKKDEEADTLPPRYDLLKVEQLISSSQEINLPLTFTVDQPLASIDTAAVKVEVKVDTLWEALPAVMIEPDSLDPILKRHIRYEWEPGTKYRFTIDSAAMNSIYDEHNPKFEREFSVRPLEEYSNLIFILPGVDSAAVVELLSSSDSPVYSQKLVDGRAEFRYLTPGSYYARMYFDANGDGKWTTGLIDSIQPEEVAYYPKKLTLKANWDIEQTWDIYEIPLDKQKPYAILKNRPKLKRGEKPPVDEDEENEEDEFLNGPSNGYRNSSPLGGMGGGMKLNTGTGIYR